MKFLHKFRTIEEFRNSAYFPKHEEKPTVAAIVVGGVTYYYSHVADFYIWVNPENSEDWVDSDRKRNPVVGDDAYVLGETIQSIEGIIEYEDAGESEEEDTEKYEQPWVGWVYNTNIVSYNKYNCDFNGWDYVDLGLPSGTLWATCNVGASSPEEYGDYFSWGEVEPKSAYTQANYIYGNTTYGSNITKYNDSDNLLTLEPQDDAAFVNMGGDWHMPSEVQVQELIDNTIQTWETLNGINGMRFTGTNGMSIFIPAGGNKFNSTSAGIGTFGVIWTADRSDSTSAVGVSVSSEDTHIANYMKDGGNMVRGCIDSDSNLIPTPTSPTSPTIPYE